MYPNPYGYSPFYGGDKSYKKSSLNKSDKRGSEQREITVKGKNPVPRLAANDSKYKPIKVRVYKNGDELDLGIDVAVTKKTFPHWVNFLDYLTTSSNSNLPVHRVFSTDGTEVTSFTELENHGRYVAVALPPFKHANYGSNKAKNSWNKDSIIKYADPSELNSQESVELYLKTRAAQQKGRRSHSVEPSYRHDYSSYSRYSHH